MKKIDLGQTVSILANLGVIAGIIFLAIEVRQNQRTLEEGNAMNSIAVSNIAQEHFSHFRNLLLENDDLFQIWQRGLGDDQLTEMEEAKFYELCSEHIFRMAATYRTFSEIGVVTDLTGAAFVVRGNISQSDRYASCWNRLRPAFRARADLDFVDRIEDRTE